MGRPKILCLCVGITLLLSACQDPPGSEVPRPSQGLNSGSVNFPGTAEGARQLLLQFLKPGIDKIALSQQLRPGSKDFQAAFKKEAAKTVERGYREPWDQGKIVIHGNPGETELLIGSATTEELQRQRGEAEAFPAGYAKAAPFFNPGIRFYRFKFVRPGEKLGFAWDGLVYVNGHWVIFPKPWRVVPKN